jgi:hypothetical protein
VYLRGWAAVGSWFDSRNGQEIFSYLMGTKPTYAENGLREDLRLDGKMM